MQSPNEELIRDTYAEFGLAYYHSEVLCRGLCIFYALLSFKNVTDITKPRLEEKLVHSFSLTLGQVIELVKPLVDTDLQTQLNQVVEQRNYLAHHFWYDNAYLMLTESGVYEMINELRQIWQIFNALNDQILTLTTQRLIESGLTEEIIDQQVQRAFAGEVEPPLPSKHPLSKKVVCIIQAYEIVFDDNTTTLIFNTSDGEFLQFCDVGLGWSSFTGIGTNWKINEELKQCWPANLTPRPDVTEAWNYEFALPKNAVLWVKKGKTEKTYLWGIKRAKY